MNPYGNRPVLATGAAAQAQTVLIAAMSPNADSGQRSPISVKRVVFSARGAACTLQLFRNDGGGAGVGTDDKLLSVEVGDGQFVDLDGLLAVDNRPNSARAANGSVTERSTSVNASIDYAVVSAGAPTWSLVVWYEHQGR